MKDKHPKVWWKEVKRLSGMQSHGSDLLSSLDVEETQDRTVEEIPNTSNKAFLEPQEEYKLPSPLTPYI